MDVSFQNTNNHEYERLFNELMQSTFYFSFSSWLDMKLWDERYESYSFIRDGKMLANICLYRTEIVVTGEKMEAYQLGAVATHKDHKGQGLSRKLMEHIQNRYPVTPMFLFANESVLDFYPRFGFQRIYESSPSIEHIIDNPLGTAQKILPQDSVVRRFLSNGRHSSKVLYCTNSEPVEWFHLLMNYGKNIYHIWEHDVLVVALQQKEELFIPYLNMPDGTDFVRIAAALPFTGVRTVHFGFVPDALGFSCCWKRMTGGNESMFIKGDIPLPEPFVFPAMAKT
ncbi:MAG: GNAT family N-acetyltransferase [Dehalobacterium sp.]